MSTKDIRQLVTTPTHAIVSDGTAEASNVGYRPLGDFSGDLAGVGMYRRANILGTVSQSGGVPTGAIIQRGSNANGEFVKYADGTQICWRVFSGDIEIVTAFLGGFRTTANFDALHAAVFVGADPVVSMQTTTAFSAYDSKNSPLTRSRPIWLSVSSQSIDTRSVDILAIGRWF